MTTLTMKPGEWGEMDGKPAISWWRFGKAAKGEPSIVTEVRTYATEVERVDSAFPPELGAKPTRLGEGFQLDSPASTNTKRATDRKMENQQGEIARGVYLADKVQGDPVLASFADEVAPESDVEVYAASGPLRLKEGTIPPVQPEQHYLADGREAWVSRFPVMQATKRPFVLIVVEGNSTDEMLESAERHRG
ncbi:hypothetical protein [Polaromonas sp. AET17H-212]|uniref:hypothetical protein n=1 Tax=Polaromonas sp. AET17H-212 TaxID=1977061 RepID=UPI001143DB75|nr:hypothetical protein [Polaromonas sp. AET17H-212]